MCEMLKLGTTDQKVWEKWNRLRRCLLFYAYDKACKFLQTSVSGCRPLNNGRD